MAGPIEFHAFTTSAKKGRFRQIITDVWVCKAFDPHNPPANVPKFVKARAMWDTGATNTHITPGLAKKLGLVSTGKINMGTAGEDHEASTYVVNLRLPNGVAFAGHNVATVSANATFDVLIGMDIITLGDFAVTNVGGDSVVSYRVPSISTIDYVKEAEKTSAVVAEDPGRNDPCPCGSGKKYKKCHGKN